MITIKIWISHSLVRASFWEHKFMYIDSFILTSIITKLAFRIKCVCVHLDYNLLITCSSIMVNFVKATTELLQHTKRLWLNPLGSQATWLCFKICDRCWIQWESSVGLSGSRMGSIGFYNLLYITRQCRNHAQDAKYLYLSIWLSYKYVYMEACTPPNIDSNIFCSVNW